MKNVIAFLFVGVFCLFSSTFDAAKAQIKVEPSPKIDTTGHEWWRCVCKKGECKGAAWISFRSSCLKAKNEPGKSDCTEGTINC